MSIIKDTNEIYHADKEHINHSSLKVMDVSPAHFYQAWKGGEEKVSSSAQDRGNLIHDLLLEQNISRYIRRPVDESGKQIHGASKEYKAWAKDQDPLKVPTDIELFDSMEAALTTFANNNSAMNLLDHTRIENSIYTTCTKTGLKIKARPDIWGSGYIVDLKSTGIIDSYFMKSIFSNSYDSQLAHYDECIFAETGENIFKHYILAFEVKRPFGIKIFEVPINYILEAKARRLGHLNSIKVCLEENNWPSYAQEIIRAERPQFLNKTDSSIFGEVG